MDVTVPTSTARICVVGAGWWAQGWHLPQLSRNPSVTLVGIVEPNPKPMSAMAALQTTEELQIRYGIPIFKSIQEFLSADIATDGFVVSTTHETHYSIGKEILLRDKHLLLEKPMTVDLDEAIELHRLVSSDAYTKHFLINHSANWRPQTKKAFEIVRTGRIGVVKHIICCMGSPLKHLFEDPRSTGWTRLANGDTSGFGWGQLSHVLAWILLVTDLEAEEVFCMMSHSQVTGADIYDAGVVRFKSGALMIISGVACIPPSSTNKQIDNKIYGTNGMLLYSGNDGDQTSGSLQLKLFDGSIVDFNQPEHCLDSSIGRLDGFKFENTESDGLGPESLLNFVDACLGKEIWQGASSNLGVQVVGIIEAMYRSAKSRSVEKVFQSSTAV